AILHPAQAPLLSVINTTNLRILHWVGGNEEIRAVAQIAWEEEERPIAIQQPLGSTSHNDSGTVENKDESTETEEKYGAARQEPSVFPPGVAVQSLRVSSLQEIKFGSEAIMPEVLRFLEGLGRVESKHDDDDEDEDGIGLKLKCRWPCPELETLAFGGYPAFDLLLRVLESRNMWCGDSTENEDKIVGQIGVGDPKVRVLKGKGKAKELASIRAPKRVTKILLPGFPAPDTLSSIVRLLGQRLSMPGDGDAVSFSYDERYFREDVGWRCRTAVHSKFPFVEDVVEDVNAIGGTANAGTANSGPDEPAGTNVDQEGTVTVAIDLPTEHENQEENISVELGSDAFPPAPLLEESSTAPQDLHTDSSDLQQLLAETNALPSSQDADGSPLQRATLIGWESPRFERTPSDGASLSNGTDHFESSLGEAEEFKKPQGSANEEEQLKMVSETSSLSLSLGHLTLNEPLSTPSAAAEVKVTPPAPLATNSSAPAETSKKNEGSAAPKKENHDWMSSWWKTYDANERRFREWTSKYYREGYCLRHNPENLVEITEDTLSGVKSDWWDSYEFEGEGKDEVDTT
ncbi:hypothetical protein FRC17_002170, partial [Serendipita sp. 399]